MWDEDILGWRIILDISDVPRSESVKDLPSGLGNTNYIWMDEFKTFHLHTRPGDTYIVGVPILTGKYHEYIMLRNLGMTNQQLKDYFIN